MFDLSHDWLYIVNVDCRINLMTRRTYLTATQAAETLGVTRPTLYAYVSRGLLRSEPVPHRPKERRYHNEDVERLQQVKAARRDPQSAAARGLHWGGPVLESGITLIDGGRLYYRGSDAVAFAASATVEQAAALLWDMPEPSRAGLFNQPPVLSSADLARIRGTTLDPFGQLQVALAVAASTDVAALDLTPSGVRHTGARIIRLLASVAARPRRASTPIHGVIQQAWTPASHHVGEVIRTALVLCADHELNVSAFTGRCVASAAASPYEVVAAALAALKGFRHGGASARALALLTEADSPKHARAAFAERLRQGGPIAGFGHPLYPDGDPRAAALLELARTSGHAAWPHIREAWKAGVSVLHQEPNLDFGLAAITCAYELPAHAPLVLFALGRTIGWIAHAMEEYASGALIRPRARYVGPPPAR
jgi:citrate synthase